MFTPEDCQGTKSPAAERKIISHFKLEPSQVVGRYLDPLVFNTVTNVAYVACDKIGGGDGQGSSLERLRPGMEEQGVGAVLQGASSSSSAAATVVARPQLLPVQALLAAALQVEHEHVVLTNGKSYYW